MSFFFFNDTATTEIYTLSLHDALPIFDPEQGIPAGRSWERELYAQLRRTDAVIFPASEASVASRWCFAELSLAGSDRKSTRLNSSHANISYAVFCLKKKHNKRWDTSHW